jgi:hypothetical protein
MDIARIRDFVAKDEEMLFSGCFNESTVRADLSIRRDKRSTYIEYFNKFIEDHRNISNALQTQDAALAEKSKRCQNEANRLLDIVYSY